MNTGIIYLIQPAELVGTNRYKIGMSNCPDLDRCKNGYLKGSRYICIMECNSPLEIEKNIKDEFSKKFKLIAGKEYYEGNEQDILFSFVNIIFKNMNIIQIKNNNNDELEKDNINNINYNDINMIINNINNKYLSNNYINYLQSFDNKNDDIKYNILNLLLNYDDLKCLTKLLQCENIGTTKNTFCKSILEKNNISIIIDLINVHFNQIYKNRIIEINKYNDYAFLWRLLDIYRYNGKTIYIDDKIYTEEFIKYGILNVELWYYKYYKLHDKIKFTDELIKFIIENSVYGFLCLYKYDIERKYHNIKISDEIWEIYIEFATERINKIGLMSLYEKEIYFYKDLPSNIINKNKEFYKGI